MRCKLCVALILLIHRVSTAADKTLFDDEDDVIVYKEADYLTGLYGGNTAHVFLLYSSWCGHCQRFAPTYKEYAKAVDTWSHTVLVSGVDCVFDTPVCRKYKVNGYPTVRFIGPTTNNSDIGVTYEGGRNIHDMIQWTIKMLATVGNPPKSWPNLQEVTEEEASTLISVTPTVKPKIVVVVKNETIGREVLLDLQDEATRTNVTMRYVVEGGPAAKVLGAKTVGLVVISEGGLVSHVSNVELDQAAELEKSIKKILGNGTSDSDTGADGDASDNQDTIEYVDTSQQYKLQEIDMQSAINTAFYMEVGLKAEFTSKELEDLQNFISAAHRCGSWSLEYKRQLSRIKKSVQAANKLTNEDWSAMLASVSNDAGFPRNSTFIGCKGSEPTTRGFTCSLWLLFHTMLTSCCETPPGSVEVLHAIHGYIDSFFTCSHCREHFLAMSERMQLLQIKEDQTAVLAFWEAHNQVNHRLSETLHDPYFPKVQFPPRSLCKQCSTEDGQFKTDRVFGFLMRHYRRVLTPYGKLRVTARRNKNRKKDRKGKKKGKSY